MEETSIVTPMRLMQASSQIYQKFTYAKKLYFQALNSSRR